MNISKNRKVLMGAAALLIWYFHCGTTLLGDGTIGKIEQYIQAHCWVGVDMFLVLSGFGLYYHFTKNPVTDVKSYFKYLCSRFKRIFITFIPITMAVAYLQNWSFKEFLGRVTTISMLRVVIFEYQWYALCIVLFYIIAPFIFMTIDRCKYKSLIGIGSAIGVIVIDHFIQGMIRYDFNILILRLPMFILGFYFASLEINEKWLKKGIVYAICVVSLAVGVYLSLNKVPLPYFGEWEIVVNVFYAPALVIIFALIADLLGKIKAGRGILSFVGFYGLISWEMYLVTEIIDLKLLSTGLAQHALLCDAVNFVLSTAIAYGVLWFFTKYLSIKVSANKIAQTK